MSIDKKILILGETAESESQIPLFASRYKDLRDLLTGYYVALVNWKEDVYPYMRCPDTLGEYRGIIYHTCSNVFASEATSPVRAAKFVEDIAVKLSVAERPVIVLADALVKDDVREATKKYGFHQFDEPYKHADVAAKMLEMLN